MDVLLDVFKTIQQWGFVCRGGVIESETAGVLSLLSLRFGFRIYKLAFGKAYNQLANKTTSANGDLY